jgi:hypothetical protein
VRLDGVLECPDVATCESISTGSGGFTSITSPVVPDDDPSVPDGSDDGDPSVPGDVDQDSDQADDSGVTGGDDAEPSSAEGPGPVPGDG